MGSLTYFIELQNLVMRLSGQQDMLKKAGAKCAEAIKSGNWVRMFGSGHSVLATMDCFPRYGGYAGWYPIMDPSFMWTAVGGADRWMWLERQEGYADIFLHHKKWNPEDVCIVISHEGRSAGPIQVAQAAKSDGLFLIAITSMENHRISHAAHESDHKIAAVADLVIDNCVSPEDAVVAIEGVTGKVGGTSTIAETVLIQALVAETAKILSIQGYYVRPFASLVVEGISATHNDEVNTEFRSRVRRTDWNTPS